ATLEHHSESNRNKARGSAALGNPVVAGFDERLEPAERNVRPLANVEAKVIRRRASSHAAGNVIETQATDRVRRNPHTRHGHYDVSGHAGEFRLHVCRALRSKLIVRHVGPESDRQPHWIYPDRAGDVETGVET